jgi:CRP/FNR family transcriptional regulator, cyclic AMP receptor protein
MKPSGVREPSRNCWSCSFRSKGFFCQLSPLELGDFGKITSISRRPAGAVLFAQQQAANGFYVVCDGEVKLSLGSSAGKSLTLRIAAPGDVIGMSSVLNAAPYEATAESLQPCQVAFVSSAAFTQFLRKHPAVFQRAMHYVALHYKEACDHLAAVGLGAPVIERLANFLLEFSAQRGTLKEGAQFTMPLSHEEVAEQLGTTRESVTRALTELKRRRLIEKDRATFAIPDRAALACVRPRRRRIGPQLVKIQPATAQKRSRAS